MRSTARVLLPLALLAVLHGCGKITLQYVPKPVTEARPRIPLRVGVALLEDGTNHRFFASQDESYVDPKDRDPISRMSEALSLALQDEKLFPSVKYLGVPIPEGTDLRSLGKRHDVDVVLTGRVTALWMEDKEPVFRYLFPAKLPWVLGIPSVATVTAFNCTVTCEMISCSNGDVLWESGSRNVAYSRRTWASAQSILRKVSIKWSTAMSSLCQEVAGDLASYLVAKGDALATIATSPAAQAPPSNVPSQPGSQPLHSIQDRWAVVVGISEYQNAGKSGLVPLGYADDDARAFRDSLIAQGWCPDRIKCFIDRDATKVTLENWLRYGPDLKDSLFVVFWAGHGYPDPGPDKKLFLACYDTDVMMPGSGLRMSDLRAWLQERNARNVVVVADACHAGGLVAGREIGEDQSARGLAVRMKPESVPKGWIYLVGAKSEAQAMEHPSLQGGLFTQTVVKGMGGEADGYGVVGQKDGMVTMGELREYVRDKVKERAFDLSLSGAFETEYYTDSGDKEIWNLSLKAK